MAEIFTKEVHSLHGLSEQVEFTQEHIQTHSESMKKLHENVLLVCVRASENWRGEGLPMRPCPSEGILNH